MNLIRQLDRYRSQRLTAVLTVAGALLLMLPAVPAAARNLGTVGPPPRQVPQRQTSAEGVAPLPLPVSPLRRSEPKAQPRAPLFIAKLAYGTNQDYMPNPGDIHRLLWHVRRRLGVWYGTTIFKISDLVALHQAGKVCKIPLLYITGYQSFTFTPAQRGALRAYIVNGGTLLGDATLGSQAFAKSFAQQVSEMFPQHKLAVLQVDNPVFRGFYAYDNVHYFKIVDGIHSQFQSPPQMLGMNIAARTAIILSPYDMTSGWDGFYAPPAPRRGNAKPAPTLAMRPRDAVKMGINLIAYTSSERNFAREQAVTRHIDAVQDQTRAAVHLGLLRHQGDWDPDPNSLYQLIRLLSEKTSIPVAYKLDPVDAKIDQLANTPVLIITGMRDPGLTDAQVDALRRDVQAGGFIFINNTSGYAEFDHAARALIKRVMPDEKLAPVPMSSPLFHCLYDIRQLRAAVTHQLRKSDLEAVTVQGRLAIVYSPSDTLGMLKGIHDPYANAYDADSARKLALNILCFGLEQ